MFAYAIGLSSSGRPSASRDCRERAVVRGWADAAADGNPRDLGVGDCTTDRGDDRCEAVGDDLDMRNGPARSERMACEQA